MDVHVPARYARVTTTSAQTLLELVPRDAFLFVDQRQAGLGRRAVGAHVLLDLRELFPDPVEVPRQLVEVLGHHALLDVRGVGPGIVVEHARVFGGLAQVE